LASELSLPTEKDKGWEFTDLRGLDLGSYPAGEGRVEGVEPAVDGADGPPVVMPLREAAERLGGEMSSSSVLDPWCRRTIHS
jgi:hypothetical protein